MEVKCRQCKLKKNIYHFVFTYKDEGVKFYNKTCKSCLGQKVVHPLDKRVQLRDTVVDVDTIRNLITKLDSKNGYADMKDIPDLMDAYDLAFHTVPVLASSEDKFSFMYLKLKKQFNL